MGTIMKKPYTREELYATMTPEQRAVVDRMDAIRLRLLREGKSFNTDAMIRKIRDAESPEDLDG